VAESVGAADVHQEDAFNAIVERGGKRIGRIVIAHCNINAIAPLRGFRRIAHIDAH